MNNEVCTGTAPLEVGEEFVRYQIRAIIGHGDHAYVYAAYDPFLDREVAIKIIPDPPNTQRDLVQRAMEQEAILRDLRHPNLVSVFEVGTIGDDLVYVVMEHAKGQTLRQLLLDRHLLTPIEATVIGMQVAEGLAFAHSQLVIHRDLKPENIFILPNGEVKVINTGITSFIVPSGMVTERDRLRGTLLYMSPEHIQGFGVTDSCDMYSLGTVLYECLAGSPPALIGSENLTLDDVVWRQVAHMPPQLDELVPEMPVYLARTVQQMLAKEAVLRFATMDTVATRLREAKRRIETGETALPDSEPKKVSQGKHIRADVTSAAGDTSEIAQEIARRAAELDEGVNSRCPPAMDAQPRTVKYRKGLLAAAVCIGSLVGLTIAVYKAQSAADHSLQAVASSPSDVNPELPNRGSVPATPAQSASVPGPSAEKEPAPERENRHRSDTYGVGSQNYMSSPSISPQPVVKPPTRAKRKRRGADELIF
jgi:serine/threonine-protein kinase